MTGLSTVVTETRSCHEFEELCAIYRPQLERAALALTGSPDDAGDLVQETLLRAYRYFHHFEPGSNFRAWVLRILHNAHISRHRQRRHWDQVLAWDDLAERGEAHLDAEPADDLAEPEHALFANLPEGEVQDALDALPDSFRRVVELSDLHGLSYAEVASRLRLPIGTVRSRLFRARRRLRVLLGDYAVRHGFLRPEELEAVPTAA